MAEKEESCVTYRWEAKRTAIMTDGRMLLNRLTDGRMLPNRLTDGLYCTVAFRLENRRPNLHANRLHYTA
jgi:hypothetical protein